MSQEFHYPTAGAERISHEEGDDTAWICLCGNTPHTDGFSPCDTKGQEMEPAAGSSWAGLYLCQRCGRVIEQTTLKVIRRK